VKFPHDIVHQKLLKSIKLLLSYSKYKNGDVFWDTMFIAIRNSLLLAIQIIVSFAAPPFRPLLLCPWYYVGYAIWIGYLRRYRMLDIIIMSFAHWDFSHTSVHQVNCR